MIETDTGRALVHPQLPEPEAIQEDPVVIRISDLETSPGKGVYFCAVRLCEDVYFLTRSDIDC